MATRLPGGDEATTRGYNVGGSMIWLQWSALKIAPGVRGAIDLPSGLQIVPGVAVPIGIGPSRGDRRLFLYLSFEHPFSDSSRH